MEFHGMNRDVHPNQLPDGHWRDAQNMVYNHKRLRLEADEGLANFGNPQTDQIVGIIPLNEGLIQFVHDNVTGTGTIYRISGTGITVTILSTDELNFNPDNFIRGTFHYNYKNELIIAWWEGLDAAANRPRLMNVDCLPFEVNGAGAPTTPGQVYLLDMFTNLDDVNIGLEDVVNGGNLNSGVYFPTLAYGYKDGSRGEYFVHGEQISIAPNAENDIFSQSQGAEPDSTTGKSIVLNITNINTDYFFIFVGFIIVKGGVRSAVTLEPIKITGASMQVIFDGDGPGVYTSSVAELTVPGQKFQRVQAGDVHLNNRLYLANVKTLAPPDIQAYVNNITVNWVRTEDIKLGTFTGSYKDPVIIFDKRSFKTGEVYGLYFILNMITGEKFAYHIPGRAPTTVTVGLNNYNENDLISDIVAGGDNTQNHDQAIVVDANSRYHEMFNTALSNGTMGYWENQNETYPDEDCFDIKDSGGTVIGTLRNEKVRHHKFPDIASLYLWGNDFVDNVGGIKFDSMGCVNFLGSVHTFSHPHPSPGPNAPNCAFLAEVSSGGGVWSGSGNTRYTASYDQQVLVDVQWDLVSHVTSVGHSIRHGRIANGVYTELEMLHQETQGSGQAYNQIFVKKVDLQKGDVLDFIFATVAPGGPAGPTSKILVKLWSNVVEDDLCTTKTMGIQLSDIHIPVEFRPLISHITVGYAKRSGANVTRADQHVLQPTEFDDWNLSASSATRKRSHPFNALFFKSGIKYDYTKGNRIFLSDRVDESNDQVGHPVIFSGGTTHNSLYSLDRTYLQPENNGLPSDNEGREECFIVDLNIGAAYNLFNYPHVDFCIYKKNMYINFFKQPVVEITAYKFDPASATSGDIYGADTFISLQGTLVTNPASSSELNNGNRLARHPHRMLLTPVESVVNIGLRHDQHTLDEKYYPHDSYFDEDYWLEDPNNGGVGLPLTVFGESYNYNSDYSLVVDFTLSSIVECVNACADVHDFEELTTSIFRSILDADDTFIDAWRRFPVNERYDQPQNKGQIWVLKSHNKALYIQHNYALFMAKTKDTLLSNTVEVSLGKGDLFTTDPDEIFGTDEGVIGCRHYFAAFVYRDGYVVVDDATKDQTKIWLIGEGVQEISARGLEEYLQRKGHINTIYPDNPFNGKAWSGAFDVKMNRLVFTKRSEATFENGNDGTIPTKHGNFTLSYNLDKGIWISFHTYIPCILFHTRRGLLSAINQTVGGNDDNRIYLHSSNYTFGFYHNQRGVHDAHPSYVDMILTAAQEEIKWMSFNLDILFDDVFKTVHDDKTITEIMVYNDNQCSGVLTLENSSIPNKRNRIRKIENKWYYSDFRDIVTNRLFPIINDSNDTVNTSNLDSGKAFFKKSHFLSKFIIVRLQYDNVVVPALKFMIKDVSANINKSGRLK